VPRQPGTTPTLKHPVLLGQSVSMHGNWTRRGVLEGGEWGDEAGAERIVAIHGDGGGGGIDREHPSLRSEHRFPSALSHMLHHARDRRRSMRTKMGPSTDKFGLSPPAATTTTDQDGADTPDFPPGITPNDESGGKRYLGGVGGVHLTHDL
jgi:hypothetical protein